tara:strand:- start:198 stop:1055 length:858 start_codon:yes stop_codon:yes gene_type:complete
MDRSICLINQKGGVGKTTSAINIAAFLAISNQKVLLIDLDPQGNSTDTLLSELDFSTTKTTYDFYNDTISKKNSDFNDYIKKSTLSNHEFTIDVMPANIKLAEIEIKLSQEYSRETVLTRAFKYYRPHFDKYDFIIIDCPPSLGLLTINAFVASQYLLVPVDASAYSHQGLQELVESLAETNKVFECQTELIGIFFAKYVHRESVYKESYKFLKMNAKDRLFKTVIRKSTQIEQAPHFNQSIVDYAPGSRAYEDYKELTIELIRRLNGEEIFSEEKIKQPVSTNR